jgi:hypothetical protein
MLRRCEALRRDAKGLHQKKCESIQSKAQILVHP